MDCISVSKPKTLQETTGPQKAVAVAKDVLKHLRYLRLGKRAWDNSYCQSNQSLVVSGSLQRQSSILERKCGVCAIGGMFISYIRLFNNVSAEEVIERDMYHEVDDPFFVVRGLIEDKLTGIFSKDQLAQIESEFETGRIWPDLTRRERLRAIMTNIVRNKGTFIPPKTNPKPKRTSRGL